MKKLLLLLIVLFVINSVSAATISGNIYSFDFQQLEDVKVTINTVPGQIHISKDGTYSFEVPQGDYTLTAEYYINGILDSNIEENITITNDGNFIRDLILFPNLDDIDDDFNPFLDDEEKPTLLIYFLIALAAIFVVIAFIFIKKRKTKKKLKEISKDTGDLEKVLEFIKKEDGRTTQKDIRKALGMSEAKASLIATELEHKNIIKRIKKGRGNVIILNK